MTGRKGPAKADIEAAADKFLGGLGRRSREESVRAGLVILFDSLNVGSVECEYPVERGRADIYLPNQRTFIEVKKPGAASDPDAARPGTGESAGEQLHRYVRGEIERELSWGERERIRSDRRWTGVVTDGADWHIFKYEHRRNARPRRTGSKTFGKDDGAKLAKVVRKMLGTWVGKEWIGTDRAGAGPSAILMEFQETLAELYKNRPRRARGKIETKRRLWIDTIRASGMAPDGESAQESLFITHSFLIAVVRLVLETRAAAPDPSEAVRGGFASWVLDFTEGERWAARLWAKISEYDWIRRRSDVMKELYQKSVSQKNRKMFGEFYTPDWLAEMMVTEILDDQWLSESIGKSETAPAKGVGVLDPACGSGTFLYHAALRILEAKEVRNLSAVEKANVVAHLVNGMDIHPVAVEMARANLMRALPAQPTAGEHALRVFVGDSLHAGSEGDGGDLFAHTKDSMILKPPRSGEIHIPRGFVRSGSFNRDIHRLVEAARDGDGLPAALREGPYGAELAECLDRFSKTIRTDGNSVWARYSINMAAPLLLAERKVDRIVANPPWVRLSDIQQGDRRAMMRNIGKELGLEYGGGVDIASFFARQARKLYMRDPRRNPAGWLVKKTSLTGDNWRAFRELQRDLVSQTVDLVDLNPFRGGEAKQPCLLLERRKLKTVDNSGRRALVARRRRGKGRPDPGERWAEAGGKIVFARPPPPFPEARSAYLAADNPFRGGARTAPSVLLVVDGEGAPGDGGTMRVKTKRSMHGDWKSIDPKKGSVPAAWVKDVMDTEGCLAFIADFRMRRAIIPTDGAGTPHPDPAGECPFWRNLDRVYRELRGGGGGTAKTLMELIDQREGASKQLPLPARGPLKTMVLYPAAADIMRAARTDPGAGVADDGLFWRICGTESEAGYLTAILNASCMRAAFKASRGSGRHFHLNPWRKVPVPLFDPSDADHRRLARLCGKAEAVARAVVDGLEEADRRRSQRWLSGRIRAGVAASGAGGEIEEICRRLLPRHAREGMSEGGRDAS